MPAAIGTFAVGYVIELPIAALFSSNQMLFTVLRAFLSVELVEEGLGLLVPTFAHGLIYVFGGLATTLTVILFFLASMALFAVSFLLLRREAKKQSVPKQVDAPNIAI